MRYIKAADALPEELITMIQTYIDGEYIYIPRKEINRKTWGEKTKSKVATATRNQEIYRQYTQGIPVIRLAEMYYLAPKTIQKIVAKLKRSAV